MQRAASHCRPAKIVVAHYQANNHSIHGTAYTTHAYATPCLAATPALMLVILMTPSHTSVLTNSPVAPQHVGVVFTLALLFFSCLLW